MRDFGIESRTRRRTRTQKVYLSSVTGILRKVHFLHGPEGQEKMGLYSPKMSTFRHTELAVISSTEENA